jgi:hypothetical protein
MPPCGEVQFDPDGSVALTTSSAVASMGPPLPLDLDTLLIELDCATNTASPSCLIIREMTCTHIADGSNSTGRLPRRLKRSSPPVG